MNFAPEIIIWIAVFIIALGLHCWALVDTILDYEFQLKRSYRGEEERRHIASRIVLAKGNIIQEVLRIIISLAFLYPGVVSLLLPVGSKAADSEMGRLIVPMFIVAGICLMIKSVLQRLTRISAVKKIRGELNEIRKREDRG